MTQEEFLSRVHALEGLKHAVLNKITLDRRTRRCIFTLITDLPYSQEDETMAERIVREAVNSSLETGLVLRKVVADPQLITHKIVEYLAENHRAAAACIRAEDIEVKLGDVIEFSFGVDDAERGFFEKN